MWGSWWELFVVFSCTWLLTHGRGQETPGVVNNGTICETKTLDECWSKLPPVRDHGIPSNSQAVENACKVFDSGMDCVNNWSSQCLKKEDKEKLESSVAGAQVTYKFLCSDKKFQKDYLQHAECYKKISHHWDECARKFIESLKRVDHSKDPRSLCCIRYHYLHCVTEVAGHYCSQNATKFLQKLAESLVRYNMRTYPAIQCNNMNERNCASSAQSSSQFLPTSSLLHAILSYPTKGLINSLNVLRNLAFSDITTFFGVLSREFGPYFSYNHRFNWGKHEYESSSHVLPTSSTTGSGSNIRCSRDDDNVHDTNDIVHDIKAR